MKTRLDSGRFRPSEIVKQLHFAPASGRPRVHVEDADPDRYMIAARALREAGYDVGPFCGGPHFNGPAEADFSCVHVETGRCAPVLEADVILFRFGLESPVNARLLERLRSGGRPLRVVAEVGAGQADSHALLLEGCRLLEAPASVTAVLEAIRAELAGEPLRDGAWT
jgi:hypothetical protein